MFILTMLAAFVPAVAGITCLALRNKRPEFLADVRGIALQTVIIIVVLMAIAGAIAAVLVTRGQEATETLAAQSISADVEAQAGLYTTQSACTTADFEWDSNTCGVFEVGDLTGSATGNERKCNKSGLDWDTTSGCKARS
ncbi:MAG: hypothetical protein F4Z22_03425 [Acidimicrobiia bacterium]|nr:hypothetical protein [Acidimicrobiia bacterium]